MHQAAVRARRPIDVTASRQRRRPQQIARIGPRQRQGQLDEQIHQIKLELSQLEVKVTDLIQRVTEELQMDLKAQYENYSAEDMNWDAVREEIADLRGKIVGGLLRLGKDDELAGFEQRSFLQDGPERFPFGVAGDLLPVITDGFQGR